MSLNDVRRSISSTIYRQVGRANSRVQEHRSLPVDILEADDSYLVVFDTPGVETDDVQVRYLDGNVRIQVDRFREFHEGYEMRFPGRGLALGGEAELPDDAVVDPDAATARLTEIGTLNIEIPKEEPLEDTADDSGSESRLESRSETETETEQIAIDD
ncbi:Hsp20 family protein [Halobacteria archaeon AArc-m2/3/4]|uniref:Hsp20 family protein n=1 Tax=Natronoglomus mannanivorans TaxID=2979990 RepID=A0AAP3E1W2_9EURY|nr:Hsp20 family protein [Halobacteria archaeon AArc-xg1-1]MCU4975120.1 Hsp20 family protein [Halobacteria archaeon AArc-m2/3/4]